MAGLIWFVQVVHYPLMAHVDRGRFDEYERRHMNLTTWVVAPPMWIELGTAGWLVYALWNTEVHWLTLVGLALVTVNWLSTFVLQMPCHRALSRGFDETPHRRLVQTNWIRTLAWSARAALALYLLMMADSIQSTTDVTP